MKILRAVCILKSAMVAMTIAVGTMGVLSVLISQVAVAETVQDSPLVVLAKLVSEKKACLKKLVELSAGSNPVTDPTLDIKQVVIHLEL